MGLTDLLLLLLVAGIIGSVGQAIAGYDTGGCLTSIAVGFVGALLGVWLGRALGMGELYTVTVGGTTFPIIWSVIGASLFVAIISLISRGGR